MSIIVRWGHWNTYTGEQMRALAIRKSFRNRWALMWWAHGGWKALIGG